jgi:hypothetical protein
MKRLVSAALALTLLGATAAAAEPYDRGGQGYNGGYYNGYDNAYRGHDRDDNGAFVAGAGFLTLAAILASQHRHHRYHSGWYNRGYGERNGDYGSRDHRW